MRKKIFGRRFKRDTNERKALFKGLLSSLVLQSRIVTTEAKAKAIKGQVDKIVNVAKQYKNQSKKHLAVYLSPKALATLLVDVLPHLADRQSGYTRTIRQGTRLSDSAMMVVLEWVAYDEMKNQKLKIKNEKKEERKLNKTKKDTKSKEAKPTKRQKKMDKKI